MPNISCPILVGHLRFKFSAELFHDDAGEGTDGRAPSGSDIKHLVIGPITGHGQKIRLHDITDVHVIAALKAILMDNRRFPIEKPGGENREDACVRVAQCLTGSIDVEVAKGRRRDAVRFSYSKTQLLLIPFGNRIDGGGVEWLFLIGR